MKDSEKVEYLSELYITLRKDLISRGILARNKAAVHFYACPAKSLSQSETIELKYEVLTCMYLYPFYILSHPDEIDEKAKDWDIPTHHILKSIYTENRPSRVLSKKDSSIFYDRRHGKRIMYSSWHGLKPMPLQISNLLIGMLRYLGTKKGERVFEKEIGTKFLNFRIQRYTNSTFKHVKSLKKLRTSLLEKQGDIEKSSPYVQE